METQNDTENTEAELNTSEDLLESSSIFNPPLYIQRYIFVRETLGNHNVTRIVDFGCAECKLLSHLKNIETVEEITGVDIDRKQVTHHQWVVKPHATDFLYRRIRPLKMRLFCGSLVDYDSRLQGYDAVTLIEVIEHLEPEILEKLPEAIFGQIKPKLVIITTPNAEYNVLFPNFSGMRHWDHKFEWSRGEFEDWCACVSKQYGYNVEYTGIGAPESCHTHLGCCTQVAIFHQHHQEETGRSGSVASNITQPYELITECEHPYRTPLSREENMKIEVKYYMNLLSKRSADENDSEALFVPVQELYGFQRIQKLCNDLNELRDFLEENGYEMSSDRADIILDVSDQDYHDVAWSYMQEQEDLDVISEPENYLIRQQSAEDKTCHDVYTHPKSIEPDSRASFVSTPGQFSDAEEGVDNTNVFEFEEQWD